MADQWLVGVDVGGTTIKIAFISDSGEIHHKWEIPTDKRDQGNHIPSQIALAINEKLREIGETKNKLSAIGIGAQIVIGGGVSKAGDTLLNPARDQFQRFAFPRVSAGAEVMMARMGNDAGILGAAWLAKTQMKTIIQYI